MRASVLREFAGPQLRSQHCEWLGEVIETALNHLLNKIAAHSASGTLSGCSAGADLTSIGGTVRCCRVIWRCLRALTPPSLLLRTRLPRGASRNLWGTRASTECGTTCRAMGSCAAGCAAACSLHAFSQSFVFCPASDDALRRQLMPPTLPAALRQQRRSSPQLLLLLSHRCAALRWRLLTPHMPASRSRWSTFSS